MGGGGGCNEVGVEWEGGWFWDMLWLPFGWKYSPVTCQELLGALVRDLIPSDILLIHHLDYFLVVFRGRGRLGAVTVRVAQRLTEGEFLVSPKRVSKSVDRDEEYDDRRDRGNSYRDSVPRPDTTWYARSCPLG